jgi:hypothetical protein
MKGDQMKKIVDIPVPPEQYDPHFTDRIPGECVSLGMHSVEMRFINGLVRYTGAKRILELGVASGSGTNVLLSAVSDKPDAKLVSVDITDVWFNDSDKQAGFTVAGGNYPEDRWQLITGRDFSEVAEDFREPFDFCVIDTGHVHPTELINFLTVLPYLAEDAVVVFHDYSFFQVHCAVDDAVAFDKFPLGYYATLLAYNSIVGDKLRPADEKYLNGYYGVSNIVAVQVNSDTRKYIRSAFDMLEFPWGCDILSYVEAVNGLIHKNYDDECGRIFQEATIRNTLFCRNGYRFRRYNHSKLRADYKKITQTQNIIFYGGGKGAKYLTDEFAKSQIALPKQIWDINAKSIGGVGGGCQGIPIVAPDFINIPFKEDNTLFVVTIGDERIKSDVLRKFSAVTDNVITSGEADLAIVFNKLTRLFGQSEGVNP